MMLIVFVFQYLRHISNIYSISLWIIVDSMLKLHTSCIPMQVKSVNFSNKLLTRAPFPHDSVGFPSLEQANPIVVLNWTI